MRRVLIAAAKNGVAFPYEKDSSALVLSCPQGVYSAARTVNSKFVFALDSHLKRLVQPTKAIVKDASDDELARRVAPRVLATLRAAMDDLKSHHTLPDDQEFKLTMIMQPFPTATKMTDVVGDHGDVFCHVGLLHPKESSNVKVEVAGQPRSNPLVKDLQWAKDRQALYDAMTPGTEEIILMDPTTRRLYEGSQTNFFVVQNNAVVTAEEGILKGTMRDLVLESCATLKIPVELRSPSLDEVDEWSGAFVTSTSRVLMPIQSFVYPARTEDGGSITREKTWASCSIVDRLHRHMFETVQSHSTKVFD
ncbi:hypothetical protein H257_13699 [Aphanomyces astaci]|uniref:Uncharacterized protein n=1 Tax=Aphanomyces astaci TaxID=112090 RepID=W4FVI6_APHAT|nr:hypothetical protein H257_13699 [Aphanomyces astaci]ETV70966.1 hypothetical protein H257_13699 [Aphanomyces astaci]|eukprot:XP_009839629.1 hypothetical protein H257_13699 [Aphanomyces astaci]